MYLKKRIFIGEIMHSDNFFLFKLQSWQSGKNLMQDSFDIFHYAEKILQRAIRLCLSKSIKSETTDYSSCLYILISFFCFINFLRWFPVCVNFLYVNGLYIFEYIEYLLKNKCTGT